MGIKHELLNLGETDLWGFLLFTLAKLKDNPDYSGLSELIYVLDKKNLFKLCEYFGGLTITIPTVEELESLLLALLLYQYIDIEHKSVREALPLLDVEDYRRQDIFKIYVKMKELLQDYVFTPRGKL